MASKCSINPYVDAKDAKKMVGFFTMSDWINEPDKQMHLDNACKACNKDIERIDIKTAAKAALATGVVYGGFPAIEMYKIFRQKKVELPGCFGDFSGLKEFNAPWASLTTITPLMKIEDIKTIDVKNNNLQWFPDISRLKKLKELDLTNNLIPPFECGTLKVKNANKKFHGKDIAAIQSCMASGRVLNYGKK